MHLEPQGLKGLQGKLWLRQAQACDPRAFTDKAACVRGGQGPREGLVCLSHAKRHTPPLKLHTEPRSRHSQETAGGGVWGHLGCHSK